MRKSSLALILAIACFFVFTAPAQAQVDIPELILEETEGGWIIENWEDTGVEDQISEEEEVVEAEEYPEEAVEEVEEAEEGQEEAAEAEEGQEEAQEETSGSTGNGGKPCNRLRRVLAKKQHY